MSRTSEHEPAAVCRVYLCWSGQHQAVGAGSLQDKSSDEVIRLKTDPDYARRNLEQVCKIARVQVAPESTQAPGQQSVFIEASRIPRRTVLRWEDIVVTPS